MLKLTVTKLKYYSLMLLFGLTAASYHPRFADFVVMQDVENPLTKYMYLMMLVCLLLHLYRPVATYSKKMKHMGLIFGLIVLTAIILPLMGCTNGYMNEAKNILIALIFIVVGYQSTINEDNMGTLVLVYSLVVGFCTYAQIVHSFGGFVIQDMYMQYGKNTLGVMLGSLCIALSYLTLLCKSKKLRWVYAGVALALLFLALTIRARAAYATIVLVVGYLLVKEARTRKHGTLLLIILGALGVGAVAFLAVYTHMLDGIWDYIYSSFTQNHEDDLTSNRMVRNRVAIRVIMNSPLYGNLFNVYHYQMIHNYLLRVVTAYGFFFVIPLLLMYAYIGFTVLKGLVHMNRSLTSIGFMVILVPFIVSMLEPTFPYAPGTGSILPFILFGYSLRARREIFWRKTAVPAAEEGPKSSLK